MDELNRLAETLRTRFARLRPQVVRPGEGFLAHSYCIPCGYYQELWDWDGFFIAVHLAGRDDYGPQHLRDWALNFIDASDDRGYVPGCVTPRGPEGRHRAFQMKPLLAQGAELADRLCGDDALAGGCYEAIRRIATLREQTHRDRATGLFAWDSAMQSGADNNPALSNEPDERAAFLACDINAFQWREYLALARMANRSGRADDAAHFATRADELLAAVNRHLWSEEDASYWNIRRDTGLPVRRVSYSNFVPLWAGMADMEDARSMVCRYLWNDEHMLTPHGLRTLSAQDEDYNNANIIWPYSNWQGPVWPIANYFYFVGLMNCGLVDEARELTRRLAMLVLADIDSCGAMHENYHADTGVPLAPTAEQSPAGRDGEFVGWNLLMEDMLDMLNGGTNTLAIEAMP